MPLIYVLLHYNYIVVGGKHVELMYVQHYVMGVTRVQKYCHGICGKQFCA